MICYLPYPSYASVVTGEGVMGDHAPWGYAGARHVLQNCPQKLVEPRILGEGVRTIAYNQHVDASTSETPGRKEMRHELQRPHG